MGTITLEELANGNFDHREHGAKTAGLLELIRIREECKLDYEIDPAFVVPLSGANPEEMNAALDSLLSEEKEITHMIARSSSYDEEPGKFNSIHFVYDPSDVEGSHKAMAEAYAQVIDNEPKAVLVQKMAGTTTDHYDSKVFGLTNISFILQVSALNQDEISVTCAKGLAEMVVGDDSSQVIFIDYDFAKEEIVRIIDKPDMFYEDHWGGHHYRQERAKAIRDGKIVSIGIDEEEDLLDILHAPNFSNMVILDSEIYHVPFKDEKEIGDLMKVAKTLKEQRGKPIEVEGAFVEGKLHLFQMRDLEELPFHDIEFSEGKYWVGGSDNVLGSGRFVMDFVYFGSGIKKVVVDSHIASMAASFLADYKDKPFFAYIEKFYGALLNQLGDSCRVIGTSLKENNLSHTVGVVRRKIVEGKMDLYLNECLLRVKYLGERSGRAPDKSYARGAIEVWNDVTIECDGRKAQFFFDADDPEEIRKYKMDGLEVLSLDEARKNPDEIFGKVIMHPDYEGLGIHINIIGNSYCNIVHGEYYGGGCGSRIMDLDIVEEQFTHLIDDYKLKPKNSE